ncbi:MAG: hypothetical protein GKR77_00320 [Legionellales bacterium]|nr:hypothetical protein [Legionellales bacterium]
MALLSKDLKTSNDVMSHELFDEALILNEVDSKKLVDQIENRNFEDSSMNADVSSEHDEFIPNNYSISWYRKNGANRAIIWTDTALQQYNNPPAMIDYITKTQLEAAEIKINAYRSNKEMWQSWVIATSSLYAIWTTAVKAADSYDYSADNFPVPKLELLTPLDSLVTIFAPIISSAILFGYRFYKHGSFTFTSEDREDLISFNMQMRGMMIGNNFANSLVKIVFEWSLESISQIAIHCLLSGALTGMGLIVANFLFMTLKEGFKAAKAPEPHENIVIAFWRGCKQAATDFMNQDNLKLFGIGVVTGGIHCLVPLLMTALAGLIPPVAAIVVTVIIISAMNYWILNKAKPTNKIKVINQHGLFSKPHSNEKPVVENVDDSKTSNSLIISENICM